MAAGRPAGTKIAKTRSSRWLSALPLSLALLAGAVLTVPSFGTAAAQDGLFGRLFGTRERRYIDDPPPTYASPPPRYYLDPPVPPRPRKKTPPKASPGTEKKSGTAAAAKAGTAAGVAVAAVAPAVKAADAQTILVVGDFMALSLAKGLDAAFAADPSVKVSDRTDGSSGLVRDDHFDWPARLGAIIDDEKPAAVVVMLGSNDRQTLRLEGSAAELRSDEWTAEYRRRMDALAKAVADRKLPLVWVGLPAFKSARTSDDVAFFNELYREAATEAGGEFVDVWDGFVDANGAFVTNGPDVAGQPARLRNSDGITMTSQGADKLAFFTEKPLEKILGKAPEAVAAQPGTEKAVPQNPANATSVPALALASPSLDGGDSLLGGKPAPVDLAQPSPRERLVAIGAPLAPSGGRADDFAWNAERKAPLAAVPQAGGGPQPAAPAPAPAAP